MSHHIQHFNMLEPKKKKLKLNRFRRSTEEDKDNVLEKRKAVNTNKSTKMWIDCFEEYLADKQLPSIDTLTKANLPEILEIFYVDIRSQKQILDDKGEPKLDDNGHIQFEDYCNNSIRSLGAALNRHFKIKLKVNIMDNAALIHTNELFAGKMRMNKTDGKGTTRHKQPINDADLNKLKNYFENNMAGPPSALCLQEIVLFNIIFYMGRRGRENLQAMTKDTFNITTDTNGTRYIYQQKDETDKNHNENDTEMSNQARIYETKGI